jgi:hypothetical protein
MSKQRRLLDEYRYPGFCPRAKIRGLFGDPKARIIRLERTQKKRFVDVVEPCIGVITIKASDGYEIYPVEMPGFIWKWMSDEYYVKGAAK